MEKKNNDIFGKFKKNKVDSLSSIKGGVLAGDTKTTLCTTTESTFDSDSQTSQEDLNDKRCAS